MASDGTLAAAEAIPGIPKDHDGPVFNEPWEAEAFAMAVALRERGVFTWGEWASALGAEIKRAQAAGDADTGATYYHHWLATLERLVTEKRLTTADALRRTQHAWEHAAHRTPHGMAIVLGLEDFPD